MKPFNEKYADLNESEKAVLKVIIESDDEGKKTVLKDLTNECIGLVNNRLTETVDGDEKEALLNVKENLLSMDYTNENFVRDIGRIIYLKNLFIF